jgi:hypothetical protein
MCEYKDCANCIELYNKNVQLENELIKLKKKINDAEANCVHLLDDHTYNFNDLCNYITNIDIDIDNILENKLLNIIFIILNEVNIPIRCLNKQTKQRKFYMYNNNSWVQMDNSDFKGLLLYMCNHISKLLTVWQNDNKQKLLINFTLSELFIKKINEIKSFNIEKNIRLFKKLYN